MPRLEEAEPVMAPEYHSPVPSSQEMEAQPMEESFSMVEEEILEGSCVSGCAGEDASNLDEASKEIDAASIMDEPMIKKAQEMFEATKITIQSKV